MELLARLLHYCTDGTDQSLGQPAACRPCWRPPPWPLLGVFALLSGSEAASSYTMERLSTAPCARPLEAVSQPGIPVKQGAVGQAAACASEYSPWALTRWTWSWKGWDGLHYAFLRQNRSGWAWPVDDDKPAGLFLDRMVLSGKIGGRVDLDAAFFVNGDGMEPVANQVEVRRWRFYASGDATLLLPFSYSVNVMAVDGAHFVLDDFYLEFKQLPYVGNIRIGSYIPAMSLEASGSSRDATFMEWGSPVEALAPKISAGWQMWRSIFDDRATWTLGQFGPSAGTDVGDASKDFFRNIARVTWLPVAGTPSTTGQSQRLLHLGLDLNYLRSGSAQIRYQSRPESHLAPFLADTGYIAAEDMTSVGVEAAWVEGPWSLQGEFLNNVVWLAETAQFYGFYVYGSYFLTGESRPYNRQKGLFGRVKPERNLSFTGDGYGALETAVRFSYLDLNDGPVEGGILRSVTAGVNWYLHDHSKIRLNYVYSHAGGGPWEGDLHVFETRFEFDF